MWQCWKWWNTPTLKHNLGLWVIYFGPPTWFQTSESLPTSAVCSVIQIITQIIQSYWREPGLTLNSVSEKLAVVFVPGGDVGLQISSCLRGYWSVAGDVQENQVKGNKVSDEAQQHHWVPPKPVALVQHPEHAPSWPTRAEREEGNKWVAASWHSSGRFLVLSAAPSRDKRHHKRGEEQRTHLRSRLCRCKCQRCRSNSSRLGRTASWLRYTSRTPRCKKWAPGLTDGQTEQHEVTSSTCISVGLPPGTPPHISFSCHPPVYPMEMLSSSISLVTNILHALTAKKKVKTLTCVVLHRGLKAQEVISLNLPKASRACEPRPGRGELKEGRQSRWRHSDTDITSVPPPFTGSSFFLDVFTLQLIPKLDLVAVATVSQQFQRQM